MNRIKEINLVNLFFDGFFLKLKLWLMIFDPAKSIGDNVKNKDPYHMQLFLYFFFHNSPEWYNIYSYSSLQKMNQNLYNFLDVGFKLLTYRKEMFFCGNCCKYFPKLNMSSYQKGF